MAFTLAHPAIILPLKRYADRGYFVFPALVTGSLIPDIGYLYPGWISQVYTHTLTGALAVGIPLGLLLLWIFDYGLRAPLLALLPTSYQQQFSPSPSIGFWPVTRLSAVVFSLVLGILSHLFWDGFTHGLGWAVQTIPFLMEPQFTFIDLKVRTYYLIKHGSSTLGLTFVAYWVWQQIQPMHSQYRRFGKVAEIVLVIFILSLGIIAGLLSYVINYNLVKNFIGMSLVLVFGSIIVVALVRWARVRLPMV